MNYKDVYIVGTGSFLPGDPVTNEEIHRFIEPINRQSERIKKKILQENGIEKRYYGIDENGNTRYSLADMASRSVKDCLGKSGVGLDRVSLLCTGTVGGDMAAPGFANMLQGELKGPPMETSTHTGICASGVIALRHAADAVELGRHEYALVSATEFPYRLFKKSRFVDSGYDTDFDSHFLRWMLSDGSGTWLLSNAPRNQGISFRVKHIHLKSFGGDFPTCMQIGTVAGNEGSSYLDYPSFAAAEKEGAFLLRQNIRLLPQLFEVCFHEYIRLIEEGVFKVEEIDHFLCHYSSEKFAPVVKDLMEKAGLLIPQEKWFSNLKTKGNTGSASIFVMLDDFLKEREVKPGQKILCFIPESGRFTAGFILLEAVGEASTVETAPVHPPVESQDVEDPRLKDLLQKLSLVWHDYRSRFWRSPFFEKISKKKLTEEDYVRWMENWIPQVREGTKWMRGAVNNLQEPYLLLKEIILTHASEEQNDWRILHQDYLNAGGLEKDPDRLRRNRGGEALQAFMLYRSQQVNAVDLLGAIYIVEGTGKQIIPVLLPLIKERLELGPDCYKFLQYHGTNDISHLNRWIQACALVLAASPDPAIVDKILDTARTTADLYLLQLYNI
jgi:3-oxoacyl-[acyl-carrier-protein] synthase-3